MPEHVRKEPAIATIQFLDKPLVLKSENGLLVLTAPNSFTLKVVQDRFLPEISRQAELAYSRVPSFEFRVIESEPAAKPKEKLQPSTSSGNPLHSGDLLRGYGKLNPNLTFDNFVTGKANQLAFAAAAQVAELPGASYNPCSFMAASVSARLT